ncbi:MAG: hypothetical protein K0V04_22720 [Deltaproteobacteria bacterium]|nr:hypothetical protein [Deltaproteobacteria bacterium]
MQRAAASIGIAALAAAFGALAVAQLVVLPGLQAQPGLVDPNLLTRLVAPVHLRCVEIALVGSIVLVGVAPRWLGSRLATTLALLAVTGTGLLRMVTLPAVYEAWARVDRVALAPRDRLVHAETLAHQAEWIGIGSMAMVLMLIVLAGLRWRPRAATGDRARGSSPEPTTESAANGSDAVAKAA